MQPDFQAFDGDQSRRGLSTDSHGFAVTSKSRRHHPFDSGRRPPNRKFLCAIAVWQNMRLIIQRSGVQG